MNSKLRILAVVSYFPYPENRGDALRVGMFLRALSKVSQLDVYAVGRDDTTQKEIAILNQILDIEVQVFFVPSPNLTLVGEIKRSFRAVQKQTPSWILLRFSRELSKRLQCLKSGEYDYVFLLGEAAGAYARFIHKARIHWDKSNVLSVSLKQKKCSTKWKDRMRDRLNLFIAENFERRVISLVDSVSVTSNLEAHKFSSVSAKIAPVIVESRVQFSNGVVEFDPASTKLMWLGSLDYEPNYLGLMRLITECERLLSEGRMELLVVGTGAATEQLMKLIESSSGVRLLGYVEDLSAVAKEVRAGVVPIWSGSGIKMKTLTLMSMGLPVVSTPIGMEGIPPENALHISESAFDLVTYALNASESELVVSRNISQKYLGMKMGDQAFAKDVSALLSNFSIHSKRTD